MWLRKPKMASKINQIFKNKIELDIPMYDQIIKERK